MLLVHQLLLQKQGVCRAVKVSHFVKAELIFFGELQMLLRTRKPVFPCAEFCTPGICPESGRKQLVRQGCKSASGLGIVNLGYFSLLIILYKYTHTCIYDLIWFFKTYVAFCVALRKSIWWMVLH